jgi:hypothetical protein
MAEMGPGHKSKCKKIHESAQDNFTTAAPGEGSFRRRMAGRAISGMAVIAAVALDVEMR